MDWIRPWIWLDWVTWVSINGPMSNSEADKLYGSHRYHMTAICFLTDSKYIVRRNALLLERFPQQCLGKIAYTSVSVFQPSFY